MAEMSFAGKFVRLILGILIGALFAALIIWIVGNLGIEGVGFGTAAFIAVIFFLVLSLLQRLF